METPIINRDDLKRLIDNKEDYVLIDVREKEELRYGMIPTAKNLPMSKFMGAFDLNEERFREDFEFERPKKEDNVIFYCRTGERSQAATQIAVEKGFKKARNYSGSIYDWSEIDPNVRKY